MQRRTSDLALGGVLLLALAAVTAGMFYARHWALTTYGDNQAQTEWDDWRRDVKQQRENPVNVERRMPQSLEPPAVVLMRDYFPICLLGALGLTTVLGSTFLFFIRGALASSQPFVDRSPPEPLE